MRNIKELFKNLSQSNKKPEEVPTLSSEEQIYNCVRERKDLNITCGAYRRSEIVFDQIIWKAEIDDSINLLVGGYGMDFYSREKIVKPFLDFIDKTSGEGRVNIVSSKNCLDELIDKNGLVNRLSSSYNKYELECHLKFRKILNEDFVKDEYGVKNLLFVHGRAPFWFGLGLENDRADAHANFGLTKEREKLGFFFYNQFQYNSERVVLE